MPASVIPQPAGRLGRRHLLQFVLVALAGLAASRGAQAQQPPINTLKNSLFGGRGDAAINGYDPVAYFTVGKPVKGLDSFTHEWMGARWKFSSQANLDLFKANPSQYAPKYGGYCAYGVAKGALVKVDPEQFTVRDGKLYLNYDADVQEKWLKDVAGFVRAADQKFSDLLRP
jgi:YHS domain-containing protein